MLPGLTELLMAAQLTLGTPATTPTTVNQPATRPTVAREVTDAAERREDQLQVRRWVL